MTPAGGSWRFVLCDLLGIPISVLTQAQDKQLKFPLNRPASLSFTIPADIAEVNTIYQDDGYNDPVLCTGTRIIKAYRRHSAGGGNWYLQQNFIVWDIQDNGDGDTTRCSVNCYDGLQILRRRLIRKDAFAPTETVRFNGADDGSGDLTGYPGDQIAKDLIDNTNSLLAYPTPISTNVDDGATFETAPRQNRAWDQQYIMDGLIECCDTGLLDVWVTPLERQDGILWAFHASPMRRTAEVDELTFLTRPEVVLSYNAPGRSAWNFDRTESMETLSNAVNMFAGSSTGPTVAIADAASQLKYGIYESAEVVSDITSPTAVEALATEELLLRKERRQMITLLPTPGLSPAPWASDGSLAYFLGDTVQVIAGVGGNQGSGTGLRSWTRSGVVGAQRIYGISVEIDDDGLEQISGIDTSPDGVDG